MDVHILSVCSSNELRICVVLATETLINGRLYHVAFVQEVYKTVYLGSHTGGASLVTH